MDETRFRQALPDVGSVVIDCRRALPAPLRSLHQRVLRHFGDTGHALEPPTVRGWAAELGVEMRDALAGPVAVDLAEADPDTGRILGAYPFVAEPRGHRVEIAGGPTVQAHCASDALGIPAMPRQEPGGALRMRSCGPAERHRPRRGDALS